MCGDGDVMPRRATCHDGDGGGVSLTREVPIMAQVDVARSAQGGEAQSQRRHARTAKEHVCMTLHAARKENDDAV